MESPEEILDDYDFLKRETEEPPTTKAKQASIPIPQSNKNQQQILAAIGPDHCLLDYLLTKTGIPIGQLTQELVCMEIEGKIESRGGRYFLTD